METALDMLLEAKLDQMHKTNLVAVSRIMTFTWRRQIGKEENLLFTIPVGMYFWRLEEHKPLIVALFLPIVTHRECRGPWNVRGSEL